MASQYTRTYIDHSGEKSATQVWIRQITAANFDDTGTLLAALGTAMDAVSLGAPVKTATMSNSLALPNTAATADAQAQREVKTMMTFVDDTNGKLSRIEIPCADGLLFPTGQDSSGVPPVGPLADLVAAFEAIARSVDGNTVTVTGFRLVGRNI